VVSLTLREDRTLYPKFCYWVSNIAKGKRKKEKKKKEISDVMRNVETSSTEIYRVVQT